VSKREDSFDGGFYSSNAPDVVVIFNHQFFVMGILPTGNFLIYHLRMGTRLARTFTPLSAIKEEDDSSSSSQIYRPVPIHISRTILPIEEEEEEEGNELPTVLVTLL